MCVSRWLEEEWRSTKDGLTVRFIQDAAFQLTDQDREAMRQARALIDKAYKYKVCQLATAAVCTSGEIRLGLHNYMRRNHEFSMCAESEPIAVTHRLRILETPDDIVTIVTFHGNHDKFGARAGDPYLLAPCERCVRLLEEGSPNALVVTDIDNRGRLAKIPLEACHYFRHPRRHNDEE
jgi:hypothetical protein